MKGNKLGIKLVFYRTLYSQSAASITMGSIAAKLRANKYGAELCLLNTRSLDNMKRLCMNKDSYPIIIAKPNFKDISEMFLMLKELKIKKIVKRIFLCGPFSVLNNTSILKENEWIDGIITHSPEDTSLRLLNSLSSSCDSWDCVLPGGIWRNPSSKKIFNPKHPIPIVDMNNLRPPSRDIEMKESSAYVNLETRRSCLFRCNFCHVTQYCDSNNYSEKRKSPKKTVDEIEYLNSALGKTLFIFNDPIFWSNESDTAWVLEFCREIKHRKLKIKIYVYLRCNPFPEGKILDKLVDVGLVRVFLGIENASKETLKRYNKLTTTKLSDEALQMLKSKKLNVHIGYIVFEPYSSIDSIYENIKYLHKIQKLIRIGVLIEPVRIIPGTPLHKMLLKDKLLDETAHYTNIMYGYKFKDSNVQILFDIVKRVFAKNLAKESYALEYYCVSGCLLKDLALKEKPNLADKINLKYKEIQRLYIKANNAIYRFFRNIFNMIMKINEAKQNQNHKSSYSSQKDTFIEIDKEILSFEKKFRILTLELNLEWSNYVDEINQLCGDRPYLELYKGVEEL